MKCPNDQQLLVKDNFEGMVVEHCEDCAGIWLDTTELDKVEDDHFNVDKLKGSLIWQEKNSGKLCPECGVEMISFNYRLNDLELELCPHKHGWWLDSGEIHRVEAEMEEREQAILRKFSEEVDWTYKVNALRSKNVIDDVVAWVDEKIEGLSTKE